MTPKVAIIDFFNEALAEGLSMEEALAETCDGFDRDPPAYVQSVIEEYRTAVAKRAPVPTRSQPPNRHAPARQTEMRAQTWGNLREQAHASYRFAPLNEVIVEAEKEALEPIDKPKANGLCLTVVVQWRAETPLLIGEGQGAVGPLKVGEEYAIPGASLRGMIRSVVEIAAFGRLSQIEEDRPIAIRDFEHPLFATEGERPVDGITPSPVSDAARVKAGWLQNIGSEFAITPCGDWAQVPANADTIKGYRKGAKVDEKYATAWGLSPKAWGDAVGRQQPFKDAAVAGSFTAKRRLLPAIDGNEQAALVFSGPALGRKTYEYAFINASGAAPVPLCASSWDRFEAVAGLRGRPRSEWAEVNPLLGLLVRGQAIPVFFVGDLTNQGPDFALGLTRLFKIQHRFNEAVLAGRSSPQDARLRHGPVNGVSASAPLDLVESLFGYVREPEASDLSHRPSQYARRGRVSFSFAQLPKTAFKLQNGSIDTIMSAPKASFAPFYLIGEHKDWSSNTATLAGRKRYVVRGEGTEAPFDRLRRSYTEMVRENGGRPPSDRVVSKLTYLIPGGPDGGRFTSTIQLHNVTAVEAGAVLWTLDFGGRANCRHLLGRGKSAGAGQLHAEALTLSGAWNRDGKQVTNADSENLVDRFVEHMTASAPGWAQSETLQALLAYADPATGQALSSGEVDWLAPLSLKQHRDLRGLSELRKRGTRADPGYLVG